MTVFGITMVRDEADVIGHTLRHMAAELLDGIIVADNLSSDDTCEVIKRVKREVEIPIIVVEDNQLAYYQSQKMTALARLAAKKYGAEWIVPFDADEVWYSHQDRLGPLLKNAAANVVRATLYNHYATALDPPGDNPFVTMQWRTREPLPGGAKVAFRYSDDAVIAQGNHDVELDLPKLEAELDLEIRHFPYRSAEQMISKAINGGRAYEATDLHPMFGAHWRQYYDLIKLHGEDVMRQVFREHFWYLSPIDSGLVHSPAPWMRP